jgi:hypothetical protein
MSCTPSCRLDSRRRSIDRQENLRDPERQMDLDHEPQATWLVMSREASLFPFWPSDLFSFQEPRGCQQEGVDTVLYREESPTSTWTSSSLLRLGIATAQERVTAKQPSQAHKAAKEQSHKRRHPSPPSSSTAQAAATLPGGSAIFTTRVTSILRNSCNWSAIVLEARSI